MKRVGLPEHQEYRDTGCSVHSACLTCPLPVCVHDLKRTQLRSELNRTRLVELLGQGLTRQQAAVELGVNYRTVRRLLGEWT